VDDDKYKTKSPSEFIVRWFNARKSRFPRMVSEEGKDYSRFVIPGIIAMLLLFTAIHLFLKYGRAAAEEDLSLDPAFNPNIRVQE